jgi:sugar phosphate permease
MAVLSEARMAADAKAKKIADVAAIDKVDVAADGTAKATVSEAISSSADKTKINWPGALFILTLMMLLVTMVYGPIAAYLVELFPTNIRYTSMSFPYHIGNGWFGGMLPLLATAIVAFQGNIYAGLWYPVIVALGTAIIGFIFLHDTKDTDIAKH